MNKFKKYVELEEASLIAVGLGEFKTISEAINQFNADYRYKGILGIDDDKELEVRVCETFNIHPDDWLEIDSKISFMEVSISANSNLTRETINKAKDIYEGLQDLSLDRVSAYQIMLDDYNNELIHRDSLKRFFLEHDEPEIADKFKVTRVLEDKEEESLSQKDYDTLLKITVALAASNSEICPDGQPKNIKDGITAIKSIYDAQTNGESTHGLGTEKGGPANDIMRSLRELKNNK